MLHRAMNSAALMLFMFNLIEHVMFKLNITHGTAVRVDIACTDMGPGVVGCAATG